MTYNQASQPSGPHECRQGFTLLDLAVTVGVVAVLLALLLPAVMAMRARADRTRCQHNLKQLGIALSLYHASEQRFPPGFSTTDQPYLSWLGRLLPMLEEQALHQQVVTAYQGNPWPWASPPHPLGTVVPLFTCPSDARLSTATTLTNFHIPYNGQILAGPPSLKVAYTSYLGVMGSDLDSHDGVFYVDSRTQMTDLKDGASQTLLVGERPPSADLTYGWWYAGPGQDVSGSGDAILGAAEWNVSLPGDCPPGPYSFQSGSLSDRCAMFHFWSLHRGGGHFLFADGGVRFLSYGVSTRLADLATRNGGEPVSVDF